MNEAYRSIGDALRDASVKYAFVVLKDNNIIEIGNLNQRTQCLDRMGSIGQPQS
jgi:hypothetical protein